MKRAMQIGIFSFQLFACMSVYADHEVCTKYLNSKTLEQTLQALRNNPNSEAQLCIAAMYYKGIGVKKNISIAVKWTQKSAAQGNPIAQTNLGIFYLKGEGIKQDKAKAYQWLLRAAQKDYAEAQYYLGGLYYEGNGVDKNIIEAVKWFKKAADHDNEKAKEALLHIASSIHWKEVSSNVKVLFMLEQSGKRYPNETSTYLNAKRNSEIDAYLLAEGCDKDDQGLCKATVQIAVFTPDMTVAKEAHNVRFSQLSSPSPYIILMSLEIEPNDALGKYIIFAIIYEDKKPKFTLSQVFMVQE
jgi:hypothetical protein